MNGRPMNQATTESRVGDAADSRSQGPAEPAHAARNHPDPMAMVADESTVLDLPEIWGQGSFPASDPPANW